jgi:hypothetical protein
MRRHGPRDDCQRHEPYIYAQRNMITKVRRKIDT